MPLADNSIGEKLVFFTPLLLLYGLAVTIQPRLLLLKGEFRSAPPHYKVLNIALGVAGIGLGLYMRLVVFKDWR